MSDHAHAQAILQALTAAPGSPALRVFDGAVPTATNPPYVVVYFAFESPEPVTDSQSSDLTAASNRLDCFAYCHNVGANGTAARAVAARVRGVLLDQVLTVTGRTTFPIRHVENQPAQRDETTGVLVIDQVDVYRLSSVPS